MTHSKCPNCGKSIGGMFGATIVDQQKTDLINSVMSQSQLAYCSSCSNEYTSQMIKIQNEKYYALQEQLVPLTSVIALMTSQAPAEWEYDVLDMVTSQTTSGTGFLTDISQSINDFFRQGSEATNKKVAKATETCKVDIRLQSLKLGGNAIIATDIDFNEVGSGNTNMLMVCMAGTAIKVRNLAQVDPVRAKKFESLEQLAAEFARISEFNQAINREFNL